MSNGPTTVRRADADRIQDVTAEIGVADRAAARDLIDVIALVYEQYGFVFEEDVETPDLVRFDGEYGRGDGVCLVARRTGSVVGGICVSARGPARAEIRRFYLLREHRGSGIGRRLLEAAIEWCRRNGRSEIELWSDLRFERAHQVYLRAGFERGRQRSLHDVNDSVEWEFKLSLAQGSSAPSEDLR